MDRAVFKYVPQPAATTFLFIDFLKYISVKLKLHNSFHYFTSNRQQRKKTHLLRVREKNYWNPCVVHKSFQRRLLPSLLYLSFFYAPHSLTSRAGCCGSAWYCGALSGLVARESCSWYRGEYTTYSPQLMQLDLTHLFFTCTYMYIRCMIVFKFSVCLYVCMYVCMYSMYVCMYSLPILYTLCIYNYICMYLHREAGFIKGEFSEVTLVCIS